MTDNNQTSSIIAKSHNMQDAKPNEMATRPPATVEHNVRAGGEVGGRIAETGDQLSRQSAQAGTDAFRRVNDLAAETLRRGTKAVAEGQRQLANDATARLQASTHKTAEMAKGTAEDMTRFLKLPSAAEGGLRDMQTSMTDYVTGVVETNVRMTQEMFRLADPAKFIELQHRFMRDYLDALMQGTATLVHAIRRTADETLQLLEQQVEQRKQAQLRDAKDRQAA